MKKKERILLWKHMVFLGPGSIVFFIAVVAPFIISVIYSFTSWNGVANDIKFIGLKNFKAILNGKSDFLESAFFTLKVAVISVILTNIIGTLIAAALTSAIKFKNTLRVAFYLPNTIGGLILGFVWQFIFVNGFPAIGEKLHLAVLQQQWLGTEITAFIAIIIVSIWQNVGYVMVIMTAALSGVPYELVEAAHMDGAGALKTFFKVRLPLCMPYITVCLFWTIANALKMFELNYSLTKGGPYGSTNSMGLTIYNDAFSNNKYGLATAESLVFFLMVLAVTSVQMFLTRRKENDLL